MFGFPHSTPGHRTFRGWGWGVPTKLFLCLVATPPPRQSRDFQWVQGGMALLSHKTFKSDGKAPQEYIAPPVSAKIEFSITYFLKYQVTSVTQERKRTVPQASCLSTLKPATPTRRRAEKNEKLQVQRRSSLILLVSSVLLFTFILRSDEDSS